MGSSSKKKKDKKKDFQKPKLKVGKARPKPTNFTDTSFKAKGKHFSVALRKTQLIMSTAIVLHQQSLTTIAPSSSIQFTHHLSLLTSRSDSQRKESLGYLASAIVAHPTNSQLPQPVSVVLPKLLPLILDGNNGVQTQLLRVFRALPPNDVEEYVDQLLLYLRAGITHLAADIRSSALDILGWALEIGGHELVSCAGGWVKTLKCLLAMFGWPTDATETVWSSSNVSFGKAGTEGKALVKGLNALAAMLRAGLVPSIENGAESSTVTGFPLWHVDQHLLPKRSNAMTYLNLFGLSGDKENDAFEDLGDRQRIFHIKFQQAVHKGLESAKGEGGEVGRAAAGVRKILMEGMKDYEGIE